MAMTKVYRVNQINARDGKPFSMHYTFDVLEDKRKITDESATVELTPDMLTEAEQRTLTGIFSKLAKKAEEI